jgi:hypothetical protein
MVDLKSLADELAHARQACAEAHAAVTDVEALIEQVAHPEPHRPRLLFVIDGMDPNSLPPMN